METTKSKVLLDTGKCKACWKCLDTCPKKVIGKINIIIHKHAVMRKQEQCIACLKCVKVCPHGAFSVEKLSGDIQELDVRNRSNRSNRGRNRDRNRGLPTIKYN